jgi:hypothetical protein
MEGVFWMEVKSEGIEVWFVKESQVERVTCRKCYGFLVSRNTQVNGHGIVDILLLGNASLSSIFHQVTMVVMLIKAPAIFSKIRTCPWKYSFTHMAKFLYIQNFTNCHLRACP